MTYQCLSVPGGWQTQNVETGAMLGPVFSSATDLWDWQRDNLPPLEPPPGYTAEELERDNPYNQWMYE